MPVPCPNGKIYVIQPSDTLRSIASRFGTTLNDLIHANPQIQNHDVIIPGQTICIPTATPGIRLPCSLILNSIDNRFANAIGVGLVHKTRTPSGKRTSIDILAHGLPNPSSLGDFDSYEGFAQVPNIISWRFRLYPTPEPDAPTWAGRFDYITARLTPNTKVQVRLSNSMTNQLGPAVLQGTLNNCVS